MPALNLRKVTFQNKTLLKRLYSPFPQKDGNYCPSRSKSFSDDSLSEVEDEEEKPKLTNPQDDTKFIVFKEELFKLFK